jgi:putative transposase
MRKVCGDFGASLREFNGEADHIHLLVEYPPKVSVSALVNSLKDVSSRRLHAEYTGPVNRASIRALLVSVVLRCLLRRCPLSIVRQYIEQQQRRA